MKQVLTLFTLLLCASLGQAQQSALYECLYRYDVHGQDKSGTPFTDTGYTMLQVGASQAKFQDYTTFSLDSLNSRDNVPDDLQQEYEMRVLKNKNYFDQTIWQDAATGKLTVLSLIAPDYYTYEEPGHSISWTLTEETDTVCGYLCQKATGTYGGRTWIAWYAPEIPVPFGPWKLTGLPGLVLDATDTEGIHHFRAISFRQGATVVTPLPAQNKVSTTREKFVKAKNRFEQDPIKNLPVEAISVLEVRKFGDGAQDGAFIINGVPLRLHPNGYVPLEIE